MASRALHCGPATPLGDLGKQVNMAVIVLVVRGEEPIVFFWGPCSLCFPSVWGCRKLGHPQLGEAASRLMERSSGFLHLLLITMETGRGRGRWEEAVLTRMSAALSSSRNDQFPGDNASQPFMARPQNACIMNIYMALPMHYSKCFTNIALNNSRR